MLKHSLSHSLPLVTPIEFQLVIWFYVLSKPVKLKVDYKDLQSITVESPILQYVASFCPQILTFCEAERYPMATCHDHWPRLEVQRETLLGDDGMRRLRHASVPVGCRCRSLGSFGVCTPLASNLASNESESQWTIVNFKASGRSRDGQMAARRRGIRLHHAVKFLPKPGQNCTQRGHVLFGLQEHTVEKPVYRL